MLKPNSNRHKRVDLWAKSIEDFVNLGCYLPCATSAKIPRSMYARVPQAMAQFVLKIEKLSHIMGPNPVLEMARAYGLRPRLWLLSICLIHDYVTHSKFTTQPLLRGIISNLVMPSCCFHECILFVFAALGICL